VDTLLRMGSPAGVLLALSTLAACGGGSESVLLLTTTTPTTTSPAAATIPSGDAADGEESPQDQVDEAATTSITVEDESSISEVTAPPETAPPDDDVVDLALVLRDDGLGPLPFGTSVVAALDLLTDQLGVPVSDLVREYPVEDGGSYLDEFGDFSFDHPFGRQTCFSNELCVESGGPTPAELAFVGWSQGESETSPLATAASVTVGMRLDSVDSVRIDPGGCFAFGTGSIDGIALQLQSFGEPFTEVADDGAVVAGRPSASEIEVVGLSAGASPEFLHGDC